MKRFNLTPLNGKKVYNLKGGGSGSTTFCKETGDTIFCNWMADVTVCIHLEASCPNDFSSECGSSKVSITCPNGFSVGKP